MTTGTDTCTLTDAEILHLLRTLAPGIPPGLEQPPFPPDTLTPPPWAAHPPTTHPGRWLALAGGLGLLALWGIAHGGHPPAGGPAADPTWGPGAVYGAGGPPTATAPPVPPPLIPPFTAPARPSATPTQPPLPSAPPPVMPILVPPTVTPGRAAAPVARPRPRAPAPPPPLPPPRPTAVLTPVGGKGHWGNDWSDSIFARSATIGTPTPAP
ncbi:MAG TPA: hypothetical protein VKY74_14675 [Chloroflexia bacterium]|nr:hypothetical protein [Chloroflexia bacterium]